MFQIAVQLRALQLISQNFHHFCSRVVFMQDHEFFAEVYGSTQGSYDSVIERMIGLGREAEINIPLMMDQVSTLVKAAPVRVKENNEYIIVVDALEHEKGSSPIIKAYMDNAVTFDLRKEPGEYVLEKCKHVKPICSDSITYLNSLSKEDIKDLRLLYLDSFDWSQEMHMQSAFHHMCELAVLWRILPSGCMIVVDDRHTEELGKHFLVDQFFKRLNVEPIFKSYQIGWVKP